MKIIADNANGTNTNSNNNVFSAEDLVTLKQAGIL